MTIPEEISSLFVAYINDGNLEGMLSLFEDDAIVATSTNTFAKGKIEIGEYFKQLLLHRPIFDNAVHQQPVVNGDIALTSTRMPNAFVTTEVARKQADGSWLWLIDQPNITG